MKTRDPTVVLALARRTQQGETMKMLEVPHLGNLFDELTTALLLRLFAWLEPQNHSDWADELHIEPFFHSGITDILPAGHPLRNEAVNCSVCGTSLHAEHNENMAPWVEFLNDVNLCVQCFADISRAYVPGSLREWRGLVMKQRLLLKRGPVPGPGGSAWDDGHVTSRGVRLEI